MIKVPGRIRGYHELRGYAALGDGRTVALVAPDGAIDWLPIPNLDSPPAFAALLDAESGGSLVLAPIEDFTYSREYLTGTNVLQTTFTTEAGSVQVTESLNSGVAGRLPWTELARLTVGISGSVRMQWSVTPGTLLNRNTGWIQHSPRGAILRVDEVSIGVCGFGHGHVQSIEAPACLAGEYETSPGSRHLVAIVGTHREPLNLPAPAEIEARMELTVAGWRTWSRSICYDGQWSAEVARSALALKLLIYSPTGAIAAAATTSLPETLAGGKNWDYRYAWVRDMAFTIKALIRLGVREEIQAAVGWLLSNLRRHGPQPHVFTTLRGEIPAGHRFVNIPGWRGVGPVVDGNAASDQLQLGAYGDIFEVVETYVNAGHLLDDPTIHLLADLANRCCDQWLLADAGIWELPDQHHYTASKLGCWRALNIAVNLAEAGHIAGPVNRWAGQRAAIRQWVLEHCWSAEKKSLVGYAGSEDLDAAVLLYTDFDCAELMSTTIDAIISELGQGPLLFRTSQTVGAEGAFLACSFWLASALSCVGRRTESTALMDKLVVLDNEVGLYAEMIDPGDLSFLGNLPQGLSHLALINAALTINGHNENGPSPR